MPETCKSKLKLNKTWQLYLQPPVFFPPQMAIEGLILHQCRDAAWD
jgi:hypothetical protein